MCFQPQCLLAREKIKNALWSLPRSLLAIFCSSLHCSRQGADDSTEGQHTVPQGAAPSFLWKVAAWPAHTGVPEEWQGPHVGICSRKDSLEKRLQGVLPVKRLIKMCEDWRQTFAAELSAWGAEGNICICSYFKYRLWVMHVHSWYVYLAHWPNRSIMISWYCSNLLNVQYASLILMKLKILN